MSVSAETTTTETSAGTEMPLTARDLDRMIPGVLDGLNILAGGANVILQLGWPGVGHGVAESRVESGSLLKHPFKRTRTTLTYLAVATMGTAAEKRAYAGAVNRVHARVHSTDQSPVRYSAMDPELQLWVAACLYYGFVDSLTKFRKAPAPEVAADFYRRAEGLGTMLQVRPGLWPADLEAYRAYWAQGLARVAIDGTVRRYLTDLAELRFLPKPLAFLFGRFNRFVTTGFLPPELRAAMGFDWDAGRERRFLRLTRRLGKVNALMPRVLRQAPYLYVLWDFRRRLRKGLPLV